jgi:hypothetical protein
MVPQAAAPQATAAARYPLQPQRSIPVLVELVVQRQAGPGQGDEGRRVT